MGGERKKIATKKLSWRRRGEGRKTTTQHPGRSAAVLQPPGKILFNHKAGRNQKCICLAAGMKHVARSAPLKRLQQATNKKKPPVEKHQLDVTCGADFVKVQLKTDV